MTASKAEIRRLVQSAAGREDDGALIRRFLSLPEYRRAKTVLLYRGVGGEIDTAPILQDALSAGKLVALPRITGPDLMEARRVASAEELVPGKYGIPAPPAESELIPPEALDLILVPGAAFTPEGDRLGRGGGYYDRYLPRTAGFKVALARRGQLFPALPTQAHDQRVDLVVTV